MADEKRNPLIGAFRTPTAGKPPDAAAPGKPGEEQKPAEQPKPPAEDKGKAAGAAPAAKPGEEKKPAEQPKPPAEDKGKAAGAAPAAKPGEEKKPAEQPKSPAEDKGKAAGATPAAKPGEEKKPAEQPKTALEDKGKGAEDKGKTADGSAPEKAKEPEKDPKLRFVRLSEIVPLPGTYVKDTPRKDYSDLIASIKKSGLEKPVILRQGEKGEYQLVDGFHRCKALEQAGMQEIRADVYKMTLAEASRYRKDHRGKPDLPIPGELVPKEPAKAAVEQKPAEQPEAAAPKQDEELPKDVKIPLTKEGQPETVTTMKIADIHKFEGHPFNVKDDKDMWDLVESIKQFGVLEPAVVIPREGGGYEMVSGHRRQRACQLAGLDSMPVIIRQLDRDEATISMVDANLKRENITPMEKARAYTMKLEAMKRKTGRRSKMEILSGKTPKRADEELAEQTGESRSTIQRLTRLTKLEPELQQMVDEKKLPVNTAADISYLKKDEQKKLVDAIEKEGGTVPSGTQAAALKAESQKGTLTEEKIEKAVAPTKREASIQLKVEFTEQELRPYFPDKTTTPAQAKNAMLEAMDLRAKALARQAAKPKAPDKPKKAEPAKAR